MVKTQKKTQEDIEKQKKDKKSQYGIPIYSNEIAKEIFNIYKFQGLIKEINEEKSLSEIAKVLGISSGLLGFYMDNNREELCLPKANTYEKIYKNFPKLYEDGESRKVEMVDKFYFSKIQKLQHLNLQQLLYIYGYTVHDIIDELQKRGLKYYKFRTLFFGNSSCFKYDKKYISHFLDKISEKTKIEDELLRKLFIEHGNNPNKFKSGINSISEMAIDRIKEDIDKYIVDHNSKNKDKITKKNLPSLIFNTTNIKISEQSIYALYREKFTTTNYTFISAKTFVALRNFLHPTLVKDYNEGKNQDLLLAYTTYNSLEDISLSELIFISGYMITDIVPKDIISNGKKIHNKEYDRFMSFLSIGSKNVLSPKDKQELFEIIANILQDPEITDKEVKRSYQNTQSFIDTANKDKYLLRKKRMLEAESKEKSKDKGKDIQIDKPKQSKKRKLVDYSSESEFVSSESENESMGEQLASLDIGESSSRRLTRSRSLSTRNSVVYGKQLSNIESSSDFTEHDIEDIYSRPIPQWTNKKFRDSIWYKRKTSEEELDRWNWNVNSTEHVTKRRRG